MGASAPAEDVRAERLSEARNLLGKATRAWSGRSEDGLAPGGRVFPVAAPLRPLLPAGGLRRGSTVSVRSGPSLLLALLAEASAQGSWCALVGMPELGLVAAEEAGLVLPRVALVPHPGSALVAVLSALLDGVDLVAVGGVARLRAGDRQRLMARARHRGAVLLPAGRWAGADLEVGGVVERWQGLGGGGAGRLRARRVQVRVGGRGMAHRGRAAPVLLPGPRGAVSGVGSEAGVSAVGASGSAVVEPTVFEAGAPSGGIREVG